MTVQQIVTLFSNYKKYQAELLILQECIDELMEGSAEDVQAQYAVLKRRLSLINHWIAFLPRGESEILEMHLIEGCSWVHIANHLAETGRGSVSCDERTLQRIQTRALHRIHGFVTQQFCDKLDYLIDFSS